MSGFEWAGVAALGAWAAASAAFAQAPPPPAAAPPPAPTAVPAAPLGDVRPVVLSRASVKMDAGAPYIAVQSGRDCKPLRTGAWPGGAVEQKLGPLQDPFRDALRTAGFKIEGDSSNLFEGAAGETAAAEFAVGALITKVAVEVCLQPTTPGKPSTARGHEDMDVEWQVFSRLSQQVVAKVPTHATFTLPDGPAEGAPARMTAGVFGLNAVQLAASPEFRRAVSGKPMATGQLVRPGVQPPIALLTGGAPVRRVDDQVAGVAVVFAGDGEGSGFLVSRDGYLLTDAHVVGAAAQVRLRWSDGREELGQVVRLSRERDVALIKTDAQGRSPLTLRRDFPTVGETVFAIGAPLGRKYQGTVTRGVVSARRVFDGFSFIQSDITVNPGGSGGPLLDEQGRVVGLTRSGIRLGSAPTGINLFIPAGSAMEFLALTAAEPPPSTPSVRSAPARRRAG